MKTLDKTLAALSHASRRDMVSRLSKEGPLRVTEIAQHYDCSLNAVSKHLKVLEDAGLVRRTRVGREHVLSFEPSPLKEVVQWVHPYQTFWSQQLDCLEAFFHQHGDTAP